MFKFDELKTAEPAMWSPEHAVSLKMKAIMEGGKDSLQSRMAAALVSLKNI